MEATSISLCLEGSQTQTGLNDDTCDVATDEIPRLKGSRLSNMMLTGTTSKRRLYVHNILISAYNSGLHNSLLLCVVEIVS